MEDFMTMLDTVFGELNSSMTDMLMYILLFAGLYFSIKLGFPQVTRLGEALKHVFGGIFHKKEAKEGSMSSFQALATAVAAQVGTGNVAGVATAILAGGPGAIFWMWVSAFLGMGTIFCEAVLAQIYRERMKGELVGGPAYYISKGIVIGVDDPVGSRGEIKFTKSKASKYLAGFFSIAIILALGFIGNSVQSNSITSAIVVAVPGIPKVAIGVVIAVLAALVFWGGMKRIASFAELVVPIMATVYILGSLVILVMFSEHIIPAIQMIFESAFTGTAAMGGVIGASVREAIKRGVARGLFSNEAGMGSTPHAHAVAHVKHPAEQGLTAMVGVFVDTALVCSATALAIMVTQSYLDPTLKGAAVTQAAFTEAFGYTGTVFLAVCLSFFAFTTIIGWYYFGEANVKYLFKGKGLTFYRLIVCAFIVLGATLKVDLVWTMADVFNTLMVFPNILGVFLLSNIVKAVLADYDACKAKGEIKFDYPVE